MSHFIARPFCLTRGCSCLVRCLHCSRDSGGSGGGGGGGGSGAESPLSLYLHLKES